MSQRVRTALFLALLILPALITFGAAIWAFWRTGILWWTWWVLPVCWGIAWLIIRRAGDPERAAAARARGDEPPPPRPSHWSPADRAAMEIVEAAATAIDEEEATRRLEPAHALAAARELAEQLARHYHPGERDPLARVTVVELVAAANLALDDLEQRVNDVVPGSHLITIGQWRALARSPRLVKAASGAAWLASSLVNPANLARWGAARGTIDPLAGQVRRNVLVGFHAFMVRRLGAHLIEMHSGRLRGGSARYRAVMQAPESGPAAAPRDGGGVREREREGEGEAGDVGIADVVRVAVIGQQAAGVSSVVAALLGRPGEPEAAGPGRHRLRGLGEDAPRIEFEELPGYGGDDAAAAASAVLAAADRTDLVLVVLDARRPARAVDRTMLETLRERREARRGSTPPPVVAVITHVDQLSPVREWDPPYDWTAPTQPKERSIAEAVAAVAADLEPLVDAVVPACTGPEADRVHGVDEWLTPVMSSLVDRAQAGAMVRSLNQEVDRDRVARVAGQMAAAGRAIIGAAIEGRGGPGRRRTPRPGDVDAS